jgi:endothelin-converting enzyme/membrane metallo-endopeptidase-like protein 1
MLTFSTYFKNADVVSKKVGMEGLEQFTARQLFWLANSVGKCRKASPQYEALQQAADPHSLEKYRILGPVTSNKEFARDWNCPAGSAHNPETRCGLW